MQAFTSSTLIPVTEESQIAMARRMAVNLANDSGMTETEAGKVAIIVSEAARNLVRYAQHGEILLRPLGDPENGHGQGIEVLVLDKGPGMTDVARSLRDGFSTGGTSGTGLGAIRRLATDFDIFSQPGKGTAILAQCLAEQPVGSAAPATRVEASSVAAPLSIGGVNLAVRGETACGDAWATERRGRRELYLVADGLGHGPLAAEASREAVRKFLQVVRQSPTYLGPSQLIEAAHGAMRATRGAALAVTEIDQGARTVRFAGIGNIAASLYTLSEERKMASLNGIVGGEMRKVQEFSYPWTPDTTLIMHSDGLNTQWALRNYPGLISRHPSLIAGVLYRDFVRGRDDVTVVIAKAA